MFHQEASVETIKLVIICVQHKNTEQDSFTSKTYLLVLTIR